MTHDTLATQNIKGTSLCVSPTGRLFPLVYVGVLRRDERGGRDGRRRRGEVESWWWAGWPSGEVTRNGRRSKRRKRGKNGGRQHVNI